MADLAEGFSTRLALAVDAGAFAPAGRVVVIGPRAGSDLGPLGPAITVVQGFRPDHDAFSGRYETAPVLEGQFDAAVLCLPRAKGAALGQLRAALAATDGGPVLIDGAKTDGIDSILKRCRAALETGAPLSKAHGKCVVVAGTAPDDWAAASVMPEGFVTAPGVFSAETVDPASAALAAALPARLPARVADLGAGWGYLSRAVLAREGVSTLHVVEAEHAALACARENLKGDTRAVFHWADATRVALDPAPDLVVMNPPFHAGRAADPNLGRAFITAAASMLPPAGELWLVANRHLPYEANLEAAFVETVELPGSPRFKLFRARRPRRLARRR